MASKGALSLVNASTGAATGNTIQLRKPCRAFGVGVTLASSTKVAVRAQGSVDGNSWTNLGAAASTLAASGQFGTTSLTPYQFVRVNQTLMSTVSTPGTVKASIIGY